MTLLQQGDIFLGYPGSDETSKPVNVASVPQRSPFRYPGGKTWFVPTFREWMRQLNPKPTILIEPFAGGGIISLTALFESLVEKVIMVELDADVAAVWQIIVDGQSGWLANRILEFEVTRENVIKELAKTPRNAKQRAFLTILKNRMFHGGILAEGSGLIKHGENGKGLRSRWYPETLAKRLAHLHMMKDRIEFRSADGLKIITEHAQDADACFFIDPPYTAGGKKAGKRLYRYYDIDHEHLFSICEQIKGDFLMTYDNADEVITLAHKHHFQMRLVSMKNTHHATMDELVIGKNLGWIHDLSAQYKSCINS